MVDEIARALKCKVCDNIINPDSFFTFCSDCGDVICLNCSELNRRMKPVKKVTSLVVATYSKELTVSFYKCKSCTDFYRKQFQSEFKTFDRYAILLPVIIVAITLIILFLLTQFTTITVSNLPLCVAAIFIVSFVWVAFILFGHKGYKVKMSMKDYPYINNMEIACPLCGANCENDIFKTQKEIEKNKPINLIEKIQKFGKIQSVPDMLHCSSCGYFGPASYGFGLRFFLHRYGARPLIGTYWEPYALSRMNYKYPYPEFKELPKA